jgi:short-subunit dehydrogenase
MPHIQDSVIVITGASSGIGRATALELARQGGTLILTARQQKALNDVAKECTRLGGRAEAVAADVTDEESLREVAQRGLDQFGKVDVWINNAGVTLFGRFEEAPLADFRQVIETNLFGYIHGARIALRCFREQGHGVLINISSVVGSVAQPFTSAYTTSKFAIAGFTESLRMELLDTPEIRVCTVLPASIDTPLFQHAANYTGKAIKALEPVYAAEDVAKAIAKCVEYPKREVVVGGAGKQLLSLRSVMPGTAEKLMARKVREDHFQEKRAPKKTGNLYKPMPSRNQVSGGWSNGRRGGGSGIVAAGLLLAAGLGAAAFFYQEQERDRTRRAVRKTRAASQRLFSAATDKAVFWR